MTFLKQISHYCLFLQTAKYLTILTPESILTFAFYTTHVGRNCHNICIQDFVIICLWNLVNIKHLSKIKIDAKVNNLDNKITALTIERKYMSVFKDDICNGFHVDRENLTRNFKNLN